MDETKPEPIGYTLTPLYPIKTGFVATQAFIMCMSCNSAVSPCGGPRYNVICTNCANHLGTLGRLK